MYIVAVMKTRLLLLLFTLVLLGCPGSRGAEDEDATSVTGPDTPLRHAVVPVEPGTPVVYMVSLVGVPQGQDADSVLVSNKVLPELGPQSPLTNLLLLSSRNAFVDNADLVLRDPSARSPQGESFHRKKRSPTHKYKYKGGGGCGGFGGCGGGGYYPIGGGGGYYPGGGGGGYYPGGGGGGYYPGGGGGGYYPGGGGSYCNTCGGGGGGHGGSFSSSQSSSSSGSFYGKK